MFWNKKLPIWTWKKVPQTIRAIVHTIPALMGNARVHTPHFKKGLPWEQWGPFISFLVPLPPKMLSFSEDYQRIFSTWYIPIVWKLKEGIFFFLNSCESISLTYRFSLVDKQHQPVFVFNLRSKYKFNSANLWGTDQLTHWSDPEPYLDIIDNRRDKAAD